MDVALEGKGIAQLDFSSHDDKTATPSERLAVESIQRLNASNNHITSIKRLTIFRHLAVLNLSHNKLTSPVGLWLSEFPSTICELNLSHNELSTLHNTVHGSSVSDSGSIFETFCRPFPNLEVLDLSGNLLSERYDDGAVEEAVAEGASRLAVVNLADNLNIASVNRLLARCSNLCQVVLDGNRIATLEGVLCLAACDRLESVSMRGCDVETKLQDPAFLEATFAVERHESRNSGIGQLFFAAFVSQVLPKVRVVNESDVATANEIVLPILAVATEVQTKQNGEQRHQDFPLPARVAPKPAAVRVAPQERVEAMSSILADRTAQVHQKLFAETSSQSSQSARSRAHNDSNTSSSVTQPPANQSSRKIAHDHTNDDIEDDDKDETEGSGGGDRSHADPYDIVMNSFISKGTLTGRNFSKADERRIISLETRCNDLQSFLTSSSQNCRRIAAANDELSANLHEKRQLVALQLKELAALRMELEKGEADVEHLQHLIQKRTRELDHAEQSNIRMVEKQLSSLVEEKKRQEESRRQQVVRGNSANRTGTSPTRSGASSASPLKLTTGNLLVMEATQRKLESLRASSPTAAVGSKFRYDDFGNPGVAALHVGGPSVEATRPSPNEVRPSRLTTAPAGTTTTTFIDPNVSEVNKTQHVPSPSRLFAQPPPYVYAQNESNTVRVHSAQSAPPFSTDASLDVAYMDAALQDRQSAPRADDTVTPAITGKVPGSPKADRRPSEVAADLTSFVFPAPEASLFDSRRAAPENNSPFALAGDANRRQSLHSGRLTNEPQNTSYATATTSEGLQTPEKPSAGPQSPSAANPRDRKASTFASPPLPHESAVVTPIAASRAATSQEKRASVFGLADVPGAVADRSVASLVEVSPPSPTIATPPRPGGTAPVSASDLSSIIERNNDAIRRLSIEQGYGSPKVRQPSLAVASGTAFGDRRPSAQEILNRSSESHLSSQIGSAGGPRRASATFQGPQAPHVYNVSSSDPIAALLPAVRQSFSGPSATEQSLSMSESSPLSRHRPSVR